MCRVAVLEELELPVVEQLLLGPCRAILVRARDTRAFRFVMQVSHLINQDLNF